MDAITEAREGNGETALAKIFLACSSHALRSESDAPAARGIALVGRLDDLAFAKGIGASLVAL